MVGMIDLSNPGTRDWIKNIMKTNMVGTGAGGWIDDFGEALPLDAKLYTDRTLGFGTTSSRKSGSASVAK